jgi:hypothetical protein
MAVGHSAREGASGHVPLRGPPLTTAAEQGVNINDKHIERGSLVVSTPARLAENAR